MQYSLLLAFSASVYGLAFDGPRPTPIKDTTHSSVNGFSPRPTQAARPALELFRRQAKNPGVCGYLDGDSEFPLSCTASQTCIGDSKLKWFGCCAGGQTAGCNIATRCIASASYSSCLGDENCYNDAMAMACTASSAPLCITMTSQLPNNGGGAAHFVCGTTSTAVKVLASITSSSQAPSATQKASGSTAARPSVSAAVGAGEPRVQGQGAQSSGVAVALPTVGTSSSGAAALSQQPALALLSGVAAFFAFLI